MNLKDVDDNETELISSSLYKSEKWSMSFQEECKTIKRSMIEFDDLSDDEKNLCEMWKETQSVSTDLLNIDTVLLNWFNIDIVSSNQLNIDIVLSNQLNINTDSSNWLKISIDLSNQLNVTVNSSCSEKSTDVEETYFLL